MQGYILGMTADGFPYFDIGDSVKYLRYFQGTLSVGGDIISTGNIKLGNVLTSTIGDNAVTKLATSYTTGTHADDNTVCQSVSITTSPDNPDATLVVLGNVEVNGGDLAGLTLKLASDVLHRASGPSLHFSVTLPSGSYTFYIVTRTTVSGVQAQVVNRALTVFELRR